MRKFRHAAKIKDLRRRKWMLDGGYWMLDDGYWMLVGGYWMLVGGYWMLVGGLRNKWPISRIK